jgi:hypothetical protein
MSILGRILSSFITAAFAIIGGLWTAYTVLTNTMDSKIAHSEASMRIERTAQIGELRGHILGLEGKVNSMDKKLDILLERK